ncbi:hypothetical protein TREMEDRAFT_64553 [Tremella mesenterica DSM 1558]|uniref:uncharacterized protein n=1 Tax=Tremella mesenterica (strain ATCC 24925 / CBS 8224 / DSM 1558 / NBRC 9311 / NRRL Y-6157 / RJB 2259-6 / UBC 559-6) TaxID=578456 RepID=UPI0003F49704|nr:uncharacterized protein TREMEDRAFT_64553 [Tremella mesenterica DSM 1558]EIW67307.1 hypothetical protein TREMEDRAFT_64553 [Tremella mesenterica DSM 1558]
MSRNGSERLPPLGEDHEPPAPSFPPGLTTTGRTIRRRRIFPKSDQSTSADLNTLNTGENDDLSFLKTQASISWYFKKSEMQANSKNAALGPSTPEEPAMADKAPVPVSVSSCSEKSLSSNGVILACRQESNGASNLEMVPKSPVTGKPMENHRPENSNKIIPQGDQGSGLLTGPRLNMISRVVKSISEDVLDHTLAYSYEELKTCAIDSEEAEQRLLGRIRGAVTVAVQRGATETNVQVAGLQESEEDHASNEGSNITVAICPACRFEEGIPWSRMKNHPANH